jgi:hypothetical protein
MDLSELAIEAINLKPFYEKVGKHGGFLLYRNPA